MPCIVIISNIIIITIISNIIIIIIHLWTSPRTRVPLFPLTRNFGIISLRTFAELPPR